MVLYKPPEQLKCCVCLSTPEDTAWNSYRLTYTDAAKSAIASKTPIGDGCQEQDDCQISRHQHVKHVGTI